MASACRGRASPGARRPRAGVRAGETPQHPVEDAAEQPGPSSRAEGSRSRRRDRRGAPRPCTRRPEPSRRPSARAITSPGSRARPTWTSSSIAGSSPSTSSTGPLTRWTRPVLTARAAPAHRPAPRSRGRPAPAACSRPTRCRARATTPPRPGGSTSSSASVAELRPRRVGQALEQRRVARMRLGARARPRARARRSSSMRLRCAASLRLARAAARRQRAGARPPARQPARPPPVPHGESSARCLGLRDDALALRLTSARRRRLRPRLRAERRRSGSRFMPGAPSRGSRLPGRSGSAARASVVRSTSEADAGGVGPRPSHERGVRRVEDLDAGERVARELDGSPDRDDPAHALPIRMIATTSP